MDDYFGNHDGDSMFDYNHDGSLDFNESCAQNQYYQDMLEAEREGIIESSESHISYDNNDHYSSGRPATQTGTSSTQESMSIVEGVTIALFNYFLVVLIILVIPYIISCIF